MKAKIHRLFLYTAASLLLLVACSGDSQGADTASEGEIPAGMAATMELFESFSSNREQTEALEQLVQLDGFTSLSECVNSQGYSIEVAEWPDAELVQPTAREAETTTAWPLLTWYSPVTESFVTQYGLGIENQFLRAISGGEALATFDQAQSEILDTFAAQSEEQSLALSSCASELEFKGFEDFAPETPQVLRLELEEIVFDVLQSRESTFLSYEECMSSAGFAGLTSPIAMFDYFLQERGADPYPESEAPVDGEAGPAWAESRALEEQLALADAACRSDALNALDEELLEAVNDFSTRNAQALSSLEREWEDLVLEAAANRTS